MGVEKHLEKLDYFIQTYTSRELHMGSSADVIVFHLMIACLQVLPSNRNKYCLATETRHPVVLATTDWTNHLVLHESRDQRFQI